jgi:putative oxidoreductase
MHPVIPSLLGYADWTLLLLRLLAGLIFFDSGRRDVQDPVARGRSIGMSPGFTGFIGVAEMAGGLAIGIGIWPQLAAIGLSLIMLGAIQKKMMVWKTGFWGEKEGGWHYDLLLLLINLVILTTGGGRFTVL